tara:strand:+ start:563 stop:1612 length:1050 start_codon:yes stop_codon:yes gene_type:complete
MSRIFSRSPYIVEVDETGQTSSRIELFLWNSGSQPSNPQYTLSKNIPASNVTKTIYNISPYIREYFNFNEYDGVSGATDSNFYVNGKFIIHVTDESGESELSSLTFKAFDGFGTYEEGSNPDLGRIMLSENTYTYFKDSNYTDQDKLVGTITIDSRIGEKVRYTSLITQDVVETTAPSTSVTDYTRVTPTHRSEGDKVEYFQVDGTLLWTAIFKPVEECKYTPIYIDYINKFGAWARLYMYKTSKESFSVKSKDYKFMSSSLTNYDTKEGQVKQFNINGKEKITTNSGWVHESFANELKELLVSERILLNNRPAKCITNSLDIQSGLNDKTISYSLEFEFNNDFINSVL